MISKLINSYCHTISDIGLERFHFSKVSVLKGSFYFNLLRKVLQENQFSMSGPPPKVDDGHKFEPASTIDGYLKIYRTSRAFNASVWADQKCTKFNDYLKQHGLSGAVVAVSGGVDSACTLSLLKHTMGLPGSVLKKVLAINQPIHSSDWALNRSKELCEAMGVECVVVDQTENHAALVKKVDEQVKITGNSFSTGQLRSYMRTPVSYYAAQVLSQEGNPAIVMGTGNQDEDGYLAYFCKYGDGAVDIQLISDLHKSEVFTVSKHLGVPASILEAPPSADLWDGQEDEKELGFTYDFIELFTGYYLPLEESDKAKFLEALDENEREQFLKNKEACEKIHNKNKHKLVGIVNL